MYKRQVMPLAPAAPAASADSSGPANKGGGGAAAEALEAGAAQFKVAGAVLPAQGLAGRVARLQTQVWRELKRGYPRVDFRFEVSEPPYQDVHGQGFYFDRFYGTNKEEAAVRKLRREVLTSVAHTMRWLAPRQVTCLLGLEQGGVVAAAMAFPRLVEVALASKVVQEGEAAELSAAWRRLRLVLVVNPLLQPWRAGAWRPCGPRSLSSSRTPKTARHCRCFKCAPPARP